MKVKNGGRMQDDRNFDGAMREEKREFKKTTTATVTSLNKSLMTRTTVLHVRYNSFYISLPSSARQR